MGLGTGKDGNDRRLVPARGDRGTVRPTPVGLEENHRRRIPQPATVLSWRVAISTPRLGHPVYTERVKDTGYEEVDHTADWALRLRGRDLDELLANAARGLLALSGAQAAGDAHAGAWQTLRLTAADPEALLVAWLEELLFAMESRGVLYSTAEVHVEGGTDLTARVREAPIASLARPIKAVTFHDLKIEAAEEGLTATVVFDV